MVTFLARIFIKDRDNTSSPSVRGAYGTLCGVLGIILNILLCVFKFLVGSATGSIAISADAVNNLSDAGSSVVTLLGFKLSGQKPDPEHPFGHGRFEYISGLIVSLIILFMGAELVQDSIKKIISPEIVLYNIFAIAILIISIFVKFYMYLYNKSIAKKIDSAAMKATAMDSLSDTLSTFVVLGCAILSRFLVLPLDGFAGMVVSLFVLYTGFCAAKETISLLLGTPPDKELVKSIEDLVLSHEEILGVHDLMVHNYGPGRMMISLHAEVSHNADIMAVHDTIDNIERELTESFGCIATIHMDPIVNDDEQVMRLKGIVEEIVHDIDPVISFHDFRMVPGPTHTNIIFDIVVPFNFHLDDQEIVSRISKGVSAIDESYFTVINVDKAYS